MTTRLSLLFGTILLCGSLCAAPVLHAQPMIRHGTFTAGGGLSTGNGHQLFSTLGSPLVGESDRLRSGTLWPFRPVPIPVEMTGFAATTQDREVLLRWTTASETNNAGFHVERRDDGGTWGNVGFVQGAGTTSEARSYRYADDDLPFTARETSYRLRQVDLDGTASLSDVVTINIPRPTTVRLHATYPNPAHSTVTLRYELPAGHRTTPVRIELYNLLGQQVRSVVAQEQSAGRYEQQLDVSRLASGAYFVRLIAAGSVHVRRLTVVR